MEDEVVAGFGSRVEGSFPILRIIFYFLYISICKSDLLVSASTIILLGVVIILRDLFDLYRYSLFGLIASRQDLHVEHLPHGKFLLAEVFVDLLRYEAACVPLNRPQEVEHARVMALAKHASNLNVHNAPRPRDLIR